VLLNTGKYPIVALDMYTVLRYGRTLEARISSISYQCTEITGQYEATFRHRVLIDSALCKINNSYPPSPFQLTLDVVNQNSQEGTWACWSFDVSY
jgi:hypothetical protein